MSGMKTKSELIDRVWELVDPTIEGYSRLINKLLHGYMTQMDLTLLVMSMLPDEPKESGCTATEGTDE